MRTTEEITLDKEQQKRVCDVIEVGCRQEIAAAHVGCSVAAIRETARRDADFALKLVQAGATHEVNLATAVDAARKERRYWRASAWALERRYPDRWAQRLPCVIALTVANNVLEQFAADTLEEISDNAIADRIWTRLAQSMAELEAKVEPEAEL